MNKSTDQALLSFALGELPLFRRLLMRVQLAFSARDRRRLTELQGASSGIAAALAPSGRLAFQANLALKLRRLVIIDLVVGVSIVAFGTAGGVYSWTKIAPMAGITDPNCETPAVSGSHQAELTGGRPKLVPNARQRNQANK